MHHLAGSHHGSAKASGRLRSDRLLELRDQRAGLVLSLILVFFVLLSDREARDRH